MNAITKERIELFIKNPLENGLTRGEQMELARIAQASLEAEPVACADYEELRDIESVGCGYLLPYPPDKNIDPRRVIPLYRVQPAPVIPAGWISCSERMPEDGQHVIILCDGAFVLYAQYRDGEFLMSSAMVRSSSKRRAAM